jgi:hypothetical protein
MSKGRAAFAPPFFSTNGSIPMLTAPRLIVRDVNSLIEE